MLIRGDEVIYIERTFRHVKLPGFITSWKMIKKAIKIYRKFFLYETDKKHGTSRGKMLSTVAGWRHLHLIQNFVTSQLWKERLKRDKTLCKLLFHKIGKNIQKKRGEILVSDPFNDMKTLNLWSLWALWIHLAH